MAGYNQITRLLYIILATYYAGVASFSVQVNQTAGKLGGQTVLRCTITPRKTPVDIIKWKNANDVNIYIYSNKETGPQNDFLNRKVTGKFVNISGYHELQIDETALSDKQTYTCAVFSGDNSATSPFLVQLPQPPTDGPVLYNRSNGESFSTSSECKDVSVPCDKKWVVIACRTAPSNPGSAITWEPKTNVKPPYPEKSEKNKTLDTTIKTSFANVTVDTEKTVKCKADYVPSVTFIGSKINSVCVRLKPCAAGSSPLPGIIIGVLIVLVIIAIILLAIWWFYRRKQKRGRAEPTVAVAVEAGTELTGDDKTGKPDAETGITTQQQSPLLEKEGEKEKSDEPEVKDADAPKEETESPLLPKASEEDNKQEPEKPPEDTSLMGKLGKLFGKGKRDSGKETPSEEVTSGEEDDPAFQLTGKTQETKSSDEVITHKVDFDITIGGEKVGTLVIGLLGEKAPLTVAYFIKLVDGKGKHGYKNSVIHKIWQGQYIEGGKGVQVEAASSSLAGEHFRLLHCDAGWISMVQTGEVSESSQFAITTGDVAMMLTDTT